MSEFYRGRPAQGHIVSMPAGGYDLGSLAGSAETDIEKLMLG